MKKASILFLFLINAFLLLAQSGVTAAATLERTTIFIGEPLKLHLQATFSKPHAPSFFQFDSLAHFEILDRAKIDTVATEMGVTLQQEVTLTSWDSGAWVVPALSLPPPNAAATKPLVVNVTYTPMAAGQEYNDVKDIIDVPPPPRTTWYWYLLGAALLALLVWLLFPKTNKQPAAGEAVEKIGAYKKALHALDALQAQAITDDNLFFTELIAVFRTYLQQAKGIHSFQQTTGDLARQLQAFAMPHEDFKKLVETLQLSDYVKFAKYTPAGAERAAAIAQIRAAIIAIEPLKL